MREQGTAITATELNLEWPEILFTLVQDVGGNMEMPPHSRTWNVLSQGITDCNNICVRISRNFLYRTLFRLQQKSSLGPLLFGLSSRFTARLPSTYPTLHNLYTVAYFWSFKLHMHSKYSMHLALVCVCMCVLDCKTRILWINIRCTCCMTYNILNIP